jgi:membrane protease YdiL (CAAX protease family)
VPDQQARPRSLDPSGLPDLLQVSAFHAFILFYSMGAGLLIPILRGISGTLMMELAGFLALPAVMMLAQRRPLREVYRLRPLSAAGWSRAVLLGLLVFPLTQGLNIVIGSLVLLAGGQPPETHAAVYALPFAVQLLVGALLPAVCEEAAYRGFVLSGALRLPPRAAAIFTGVLFASMHLTLLRFAPLAILGTVLSLAVLRTGSILPGVIGHFLHNAIALVLMALRDPAAGHSPGSTTELLVTAGVWGLVAIAAGFGVRQVLRQMGPLPDAAGGAGAGPLPAATGAASGAGAGSAPWEQPWAPGERKAVVPLVLATLLLLFAGLVEMLVTFGPAGR